MESTLSPDFKGDINKVVLEISDEILESRKYFFKKKSMLYLLNAKSLIIIIILLFLIGSKLMENLNDLSSQLDERNSRMAILIKFINNSDITDKVFIHLTYSFVRYAFILFSSNIIDIYLLLALPFYTTTIILGFRKNNMCKKVMEAL